MKPKKRQKHEENIHVAIANYIKMQYPDVIFTSDSSGIRVAMHTAIQMKKQRSVHKLPDLIILEPRKGYHGLIIELKKNKSEYLLKNGSLSQKKHIQEQAATLDLLRNKGYFADFAGGFDDCKWLIDWYLHLFRKNI